MTYRLSYAPRFQKHYKALSAPEKTQLKNKLNILIKDPLHPSLRTKKVQGTKNYYECSINMDIRIIWYYENDHLIILHDVGHHDILNKY